MAEGTTQPREESSIRQHRQLTEQDALEIAQCNEESQLLRVSNHSSDSRAPRGKVE